jgi:hypothetical protein
MQKILLLCLIAFALCSVEATKKCVVHAYAKRGCSGNAVKTLIAHGHNNTKMIWGTYKSFNASSIDCLVTDSKRMKENNHYVYKRTADHSQSLKGSWCHNLWHGNDGKVGLAVRVATKKDHAAILALHKWHHKHYTTQNATYHKSIKYHANKTKETAQSLKSATSLHGLHKRSHSHYSNMSKFHLKAAESSHARYKSLVKEEKQLEEMTPMARYIDRMADALKRENRAIYNERKKIIKQIPHYKTESESSYKAHHSYEKLNKKYSKLSQKSLADKNRLAQALKYHEGQHSSAKRMSKIYKQRLGEATRRLKYHTKKAQGTKHKGSQFEVHALEEEEEY